MAIELTIIRSLRIDRGFVKLSISTVFLPETATADRYNIILGQFFRVARYSLWESLTRSVFRKPGWVRV
ncbi:MAG: hypothetical protein D6728_11595 [Cyanobacteria bacterium J055]|nr:MAG: hypothetical protein D6728_11595 [Cyanobacteria bacterium J055]